MFKEHWSKWFFCSTLRNIQFEQDGRSSWDFTCRHTNQVYQHSPSADSMVVQCSVQIRHHLQICMAVWYKVYLLHKVFNLLLLSLRLLYWYSNPQFMYSFHTTLVAISKCSELFGLFALLKIKTLCYRFLYRHKLFFSGWCWHQHQPRSCLPACHKVIASFQSVTQIHTLLLLQTKGLIKFWNSKV